MRNKGIAADVKGDYAQALKIYFVTLPLAEKIGYKKGIGRLYNNIALIYQNQGKYSEALKNHFKSLKIREEIEDKKGIAASLNNIANTYENQDKYLEALKNHFKSFKIREEIGDRQGIAASLNNIGIIYEAQGKYSEALKNHFKSLKIREEIGDRQGIAASLNNIGTVYEAQGKYSEALENYFKSFKIREDIGDRQGIAVSLNNIGVIYDNQKKYPEALENFFKSLKIFEELSNKQEIANTKNGLARVYLALKNYASAIKYAQEGLEIAKEIGEKSLIRDTNENLSKIYKAMDKYELALLHHEQFKSYADSLNNLETENKTANLQAQYEFDKKTAVMQAKQEKKDFEQEKQRNQLYWLIFSIFLGLVSTFVILLLISRSRKKIQKAYSKLEISNAQVRQAKDEIKVQAEELQKLNHFKDNLFSIIAHDLRAPMAALQGIISILDPEILDKPDLVAIQNELTERFKTTDKILQDLLQWTKDQMQGESIHAKCLNLNEIASEKINLFSTTAQNKNINLSNEITPDTEVFADENHVNIILQNLLSNALKFTFSGGKVVLKSQIVGKMLQIMVKDTGQGMGEEQQRKLFSAQYFTTRGTAGEKGSGLGLHLVKSLVEKNGGKIWINSEEGKGSEFCFLLPTGGQTIDQK